jgi:two-component system sensor histidine kinase KdpD
MGLTDANLVVPYLLAIVLVAAWWGRGPAIAASIVSVVLFNFFFTLPYYTLVVQDPQQVYTLGVMLAIALIVSELTSRMREQARIATDRERRTAALYPRSHALRTQLVGCNLLGHPGATRRHTRGKGDGVHA